MRYSDFDKIISNAHDLTMKQMFDPNKEKVNPPIFDSMDDGEREEKERIKLMMEYTNLMIKNALITYHLEREKNQT